MDREAFKMNYFLKAHPKA